MRIINKIGNEQLLEREKTLFLCSKHTPYEIYPIIFDWVENLYETDCVMCFKTTEMEFEVMTSLLVHKVPTILVVMKRFTDVYNLQIEMALKEGRMLILVLERDEPRGAGQTPRLRNEFVVNMADKIVCGYVNSNGSVFSLLAGRKNVELLLNRDARMAAEELDKKNSRWTVGEDKTLLRMFYEDLGVHEIHKRLRRSYLSIKNRISSITLPEQLLKGREFEDFVLLELLGIGSKGNTMKLLEWRGDKSIAGVFPESNSYPDFVISLDHRKKVALECKWRKKLPTSLKKDVFFPERIELFKSYSDDTSISIWFIIGVGGEPSSPELLYLVPLSAVDYILSKKQSITEFLCNDSLTIDDFVIKYTYRYDEESGNYVKEPLEHNLRKS
ncbi:hypothetical protein CIK99_04245 [Prevotella sp. P5-92]|uniref:hypothetical protein n=1 Tax=Prevotella sp. P5-92 TaxID=2024222 RepID=UPI000BCF3ED1|nr:hypothetical protein [Prevotella sp. P5-92]OYP58513.1 hypothetical protein CIK99_04245 [Prevotella sp. P5-92]